MIRDEKQRLSKVEAGRKGGLAPKIGSRPESKTEAKGGSPTPTPTPTPTTKEQQPSSPTATHVDDAETIYKAYPRHVGHKAAIAKIEIAIREKAKTVARAKAVEFLLSRTKTYASAVAKWPEDKKEFIPHPATWFHQGRYDDDPTTWERGKPPAEDEYFEPRTAPLTAEELGAIFGPDAPVTIKAKQDEEKARNEAAQ